MNNEDLKSYHKHITDTYDERSAIHDKSEWHRKTALKLINDRPPRPGDTVLDIGTGTGTIALHAASLIGDTGKSIGIDISEGMLAQARAKLSSMNLSNTEFLLMDAERLSFQAETFDCIYCASAFFCILNPLQTLKQWYGLLKPGGMVGLHGQPDTSYYWVRETRKIFNQHGYPYLINEATATLEKSEQLLKDAGFTNIEIHLVEEGYSMPAEQARDSFIDETDFFPGQYPHPVKNVPGDILEQLELEYHANIEKLIDKEKIWNDISMYYIYGYK